jgi:DNA-binding NarL/FixJ family response regulator
MSKGNPPKQPAAARKRVLLVDDHPIVRQGIRLLIAQEADLEVCGEADSVPAALAAIQETRPDIAVVDLSLKGASGLELIKDIRIRFPQLQVLVLSMRDEAFYAERSLRAGARGYIRKEEGSERIIEGLRKVLAGEIYLSQAMASTMISRLAAAAPAGDGPSTGALSDRELAVFELIGAGLPTRDIAEKLHVSIKTVESYREHIKEKLHLANATQLLKQAIEWVRQQDN